MMRLNVGNTFSIFLINDKNFSKKLIIENIGRNVEYNNFPP